jgi:hypothetical protein
MGRNVRRLRGEHTSEELAQHMRPWGLGWGSAKIFEIENGRVSPTLPTIYFLTLALAGLLGHPVAPDRLFDGEGTVSTPGGDIELALLRAVLSPVPPERPKPIVTAEDHWSPKLLADWPKRLSKRPKQLIINTRVAMTDTDLRIAKDLGHNPLRVAAAMEYLWQKPLSAKRNEEAGPDASPQRKGRITRELRAKLREVVEE